MNRDLHVIKEEDECSNHLLNSVAKIIKCAGEANVDKICRKLRNNSNIQFSKFQVEKAIDAAVQKGIVDVKNDFYKLKDSHEARKAISSSHREESGKEPDSKLKSDMHVGFQTCYESHNSESQKCPNCGVNKKDTEKASKAKVKSKKVKEKSKEDSELKCKKKRSNNQGKNLRKMKKHKEKNEKNCLSKNETDNNSTPSDKRSQSLNSLNSSYSNIDFLEAFEEESKRKEVKKLKRKKNQPKKSHSPENDNERWSPFKTDSESEVENIQELPKKKKTWSSINKTKKTKVSENDNSRVRNRSTSLFVEDWFEQSNEPQGAIMQSNNLLQIEPMDLLVVKNPQPASYFM